MKARFNPEISLGQLCVVAALLITLGVIEVPRASEFAVMKAAVGRQELLLDRLNENQKTANTTLERVTLLLEQHLTRSGQPIPFNPLAPPKQKSSQP